MTTLDVDYGGHRFLVELRTSDRATLDLAVSPSGDVVATMPFDADIERARALVRKRARWILAQQSYFAQFRPRTPQRRWVPGETHRYLGRQYRLRIADAAASTPRTRLSGGFLLIDGIAFEDPTGIERVVRDWYRARAHDVVKRRLPICSALFSPATAPTAVTIRVMTTRWASMSPSGRLSVNPDLMRAPRDAIDYVLTHELAHRFVPDHGPRFAALMDAVMPDHTERKRRLERATA